MCEYSGYLPYLTYPAKWLRLGGYFEGRWPFRLCSIFPTVAGGV